jgi:hypothetical protein
VRATGAIVRVVGLTVRTPWVSSPCPSRARYVGQQRGSKRVRHGITERAAMKRGAGGPAGVKIMPFSGRHRGTGDAHC